jgi:hypothetical protein
MAMNYYQYAGIIAIVIAAIGAVRFAILGVPTAAFVGIPGLGGLMTLYLASAGVAILGVVVYLYGGNLQKKQESKVK